MKDRQLRVVLTRVCDTWRFWMTWRLKWERLDPPEGKGVT